MTWTDEGWDSKFVGGPTRFGRHYAKDYESCANYPGWPKPSLRQLRGPARKAVAYPPRRQIDGVRLSLREFEFVKMLSCKSRVVFWLYYKFKWPARRIAEAFCNSIIDQCDVYIRNKPIKAAMFAAENEDKRIDWAEARSLLDDGATLKEIAEFYSLHLDTVKKNLS